MRTRLGTLRPLLCSPSASPSSAVPPPRWLCRARHSPVQGPGQAGKGRRAPGTPGATRASRSCWELISADPRVGPHCRPRQAGVTWGLRAAAPGRLRSEESPETADTSGHLTKEMTGLGHNRAIKARFTNIPNQPVASEAAGKANLEEI